ncbi:hypothetical protein [Parasitella parasitica]|uniref:Uncharacterized protein n=1 Tax=Parasitella parasitica TaxID=35722 RepID=A0A0B7NHM2_9FUNG|nr:hypothetical protein [Parasitella parasitica]
MTLHTINYNETLPTQSCLASSVLQSSRKRKRSHKTVRFDIENVVIIDTWSSLDYDRGYSSFPSIATTQYKLNPALNMIPSITKPTLSLEIPASPCDSEASSPDIEIPAANCLKKKKPKLTVNTNICTGGPLFFTKLSTNHVKHGIQDDIDDCSNDYLVPMTAVTPSSTAFFSY